MHLQAMRLVCTALASAKQLLTVIHAQVALQPRALRLRGGLARDEVRKVVEEDFGHRALRWPLTIHIRDYRTLLLAGQIFHSESEWHTDLANLTFCA